MQGNLWKTKYEHLSACAYLTGIIFLPLYVFYDDLECGNAFVLIH